jgi:hypothetical protein
MIQDLSWKVDTQLVKKFPAFTEPKYFVRIDQILNQLNQINTFT